MVIGVLDVVNHVAQRGKCGSGRGSPGFFIIKMINLKGLKADKEYVTGLGNLLGYVPKIFSEIQLLFRVRDRKKLPK